MGCKTCDGASLSSSPLTRGPPAATADLHTLLLQVDPNLLHMRAWSPLPSITNLLRSNRACLLAQDPSLAPGDCCRVLGTAHAALLGTPRHSPIALTSRPRRRARHNQGAFQQRLQPLCTSRLAPRQSSANRRLSGHGPCCAALRRRAACSHTHTHSHSQLDTHPAAAKWPSRCAFSPCRPRPCALVSFLHSQQRSQRSVPFWSS